MKQNRIDISYGNRLSEQIAKIKKMKKQPRINSWDKIDIAKIAVRSMYKEGPDCLIYRKMPDDNTVVLARMTNESSSKSIAYRVQMDIKVTPLIEDSSTNEKIQEIYMKKVDWKSIGISLGMLMTIIGVVCWVVFVL